MALLLRHPYRNKPSHRTPNLGHPLAKGLVCAYASTNSYGIWTRTQGLLLPTSVTASAPEKGHIEHSNGHVLYGVPSRLNAGLTNATLFYRVIPRVSVGTSQKGGWGLHDHGNNHSRFSIGLSVNDLFFNCDTSGALRNIRVDNVLNVNTQIDLGMRYDGSQAVGGDRLRAYVDGTEYSDTDAFPTSLLTTYDRFYLGAYGYGSAAYDYYSTSIVGYIWDRTLSVAELDAIRENPFQVFERRIWVPVVAAAGSTVSPTTGTIGLSGHAPTAFRHITQNPTTGTVAFSGLAPTVFRTITQAPTTGEIAYSGLAPTISAITGTSVSPGLGTASYEGIAPTAFRAVVLSPTTGEAGYSGLTPTAVTPGATLPDTGTASYEGLAPTITKHVNLTPTTGEAGYSGLAPTATGLVPGAVSPTLGTMGLSGRAPTATKDSIFGVWNPIDEVSTSWIPYTRVTTTWTDI